MIAKSNEEIYSILEEYEEESRAIRKEISSIPIFTEGRISWTESWKMSREDRYNIYEQIDKMNKETKKAIDKSRNKRHQ